MYILDTASKVIAKEIKKVVLKFSNIPIIKKEYIYISMTTNYNE